MKKTLQAQLLRDVVPTQSGKEEVVLRHSHSPLSNLYKTEEFQAAWENDIRFHVARNLVYLRRFRELSQKAVGKAVGTSQSAP
jgi:hypothetical protein